MHNIGDGCKFDFFKNSCINFNIHPTFRVDAVFFKINDEIEATIGTLYLSKKRAYTGSDSSTQIIPNQALVDLGLNFKSIAQDYSLRLSLHDLFDEGMKIASAWDSRYDVLSYKGREISVDLRYHF